MSPCCVFDMVLVGGWLWLVFQINKTTGVDGWLDQAGQARVQRCRTEMAADDHDDDDRATRSRMDAIAAPNSAGSRVQSNWMLLLTLSYPIRPCISTSWIGSHRPSSFIHSRQNQTKPNQTKPNTVLATLS